jgi:hypothetical protein
MSWTIYLEKDMMESMMLPELIAADARDRGLNREEARRELSNDFPMLSTAQIDQVLDTVYAIQREHPVGGGMQRAGTA